MENTSIGTNQIDVDASSDITPSGIEFDDFSSYDYEDFLFEFSELVQSLKFLTTTIANTNEVDVASAAPILRILTNNFIDCYNHFSQIGSVLFSASFLLIDNEIKTIDSVLEKFNNNID